MSAHSRAWLFLYHPLSLPLAVLTARELRNLGLECNLIYAEHSYWKYVRLENYFDLFSVVHRMPDLLLADNWTTFWAMREKIVAERRSVSTLGLTDTDIIVSFCSTCFLPLNILFSKYPKVPKLLVSSSNSYKFVVDREALPASSRFSWQSILNFVCGLPSTKLRIMKTDAGTFAEWGLYFAKPLVEVFKALLVLDPCYSRTPRDLQAVNVRQSKVTLPWTISEGREKRPKVIFFSAGMVLYVKPELRPTMIDAVNGFLDFLREIFDEHFELIYRPHPYYEAEQLHLNLSRFTIEMDGELTELYLQRERSNIQSVFSDISSSSITALAFGLSAFSFAKLLPVSEIELSSFLSQFADVPQEHWLTSLDPKVGLPAVPVAVDGAENLGFRDSIRWAVKKCLPEAKFLTDREGVLSRGGDADDHVSRPHQDQSHTVQNLRAEIKRLQIHVEESRLKDLALMQKEQVIQELKKAADERLEVIQQLSKRR